jgi:hypothetical protein
MDVQASVALRSTRAHPWWLDDDEDDSPTLEFVVHHADLAEDDEQAPALFAFELNRREAALTALMELAASDARADDDPATRELLVPRFTPADFDASQIDALLALDAKFDLGEHDIEIEAIDLEIDESPPPRAVRRAPSRSTRIPTWDAVALATAPTTAAEWSGSTWVAVAALVFAVEVLLALALLAS